MANIVPFQEQAVPSHIAKFVADPENVNIDPKNNVPQLSFRGKVFRQVIDGEERTLLDKDGDPVSAVNVVVVDHNKARSRAYYEGEYVEGKSTPPVCWSSDGVVPDDSVQNKQAPTCAKCPQSVKGSKITANKKETTACGTFKRIAVVPLVNVTRGNELVPLRLQIPQTSMWDKNNPEQEAKGFYAWDQYLDMLRARGALNTGVVATKIKLDPKPAYPKLLFAATRWLEPEEMDRVRPLFNDEDVKKLLNAPENVAAQRTATHDEPEAEPEVEAEAEVEAEPAEDEAAGFDDSASTRKAAKAVVETEQEDEPKPPKKAAKDVAKAAVAKAATKPAPKANGKGGDPGLSDLLDEWDNDTK